ncbi:MULTISPECIES: hypothetical protein [unclassified Pseudofrankia]|uniref:hypothetical protein n=1 Tax=unclassified Pseudofrankia TaxID=2994372 RepID=UPI0008D90487|nr:MULTISPECIES: hypothetical protein [unclassified Pseudofrankia]MDT3446462.1 hypothetical protein [Pseudofrankia sp. BMG5.37]OHV59241.1 hypothetical protein BCD48_41755 [Pseudofrankia sp. BMG5.36]
MPDPVVVRLLVALCAALAVIAGILARADGASLPGATLRGGAAFAGALGLALAVLAALGAL